MGRRFKRHFSKKDIDGQNVCEEMLSFTCHQENANQNHDDHTHQMAFIKKTSVGIEVDK